MTHPEPSVAETVTRYCVPVQVKTIEEASLFGEKGVSGMEVDARSQSPRADAYPIENRSPLSPGRPPPPPPAVKKWQRLEVLRSVFFAQGKDRLRRPGAGGCRGRDKALQDRLGRFKGQAS